jgi:hypothetical protein
MRIRWYADALYVGTQQQYNQYVRDRQTQDLVNEEQMTAQMYQDSNWNWGSWGPWGAQYGFVYYSGGF